jgi:hypothetical protein
VRAAVVIVASDCSDKKDHAAPDRPMPLAAGLRYMIDGEGRRMIGPNGQFITLEETAYTTDSGGNDCENLGRDF